MAESTYRDTAYCYLVKYLIGAETQYDLFIVVHTQPNKSVNFVFTGSSNVMPNAVKIQVNVVDQPNTPADYITKHYSAIKPTIGFNEGTAQILVENNADGHKWKTYLYYLEADDIQSLNNVDIIEETAINSPYVYMHGYNNMQDDHFPRMLVARKGYDYAADPGAETPTELPGTSEHTRTVKLTVNNAHITLQWFAPNHLNNANHKYNDPFQNGHYNGVIEYSDNPKKKKGRIKNNSHPVQPGGIIQQVNSPKKSGTWGDKKSKIVKRRS